MKILGINRLNRLKNNAEIQRQMDLAWRDFIDEVRERLLNDLEEITRHWRTPTKFEIDYEIKGTTFLIVIRCSNPVFNYLDQGTQPHLITPVNAKVLRFVVDGRVIYTREVQHPGTEAREWTAQIALAVSDDMPRLYQTTEAAQVQILGG